MTWVTFDDGAPKHDKLIAAGAKACWLWASGLAHCYRQDSDDGFIPETTVHLGALYPGLGKKEAETLVKVGLWERADGGYLIHDFLEWKHRRFNGTKNTLGKTGGSVSSEAKRAAALKREANKRLAQQGTTESTETTTATTTVDHTEAQRNHNGVTLTTSPTATGSDSGSGISDPVSSPDPEQSESFSSPRERPVRPKPLLAVRVTARDYEPLEAHRGYAASLGVTMTEYATALLDMRDKFGGRVHDAEWLDGKLCAFLEQVSRSKQAGPRRSASGHESPAERRTREQLERVARLEAEERDDAQGPAQ